MAGGGIGMIVHRFAPFPTAERGAHAFVGMGTLFAGIIRAPMSSVLMVFEITQDYQILVSLRGRENPRKPGRAPGRARARRRSMTGDGSWTELEGFERGKERAP